MRVAVEFFPEEFFGVDEFAAPEDAVSFFAGDADEDDCGHAAVGLFRAGARGAAAYVVERVGEGEQVARGVRRQFPVVFRAVFDVELGAAADDGYVAVRVFAESLAEEEGVPVFGEAVSERGEIDHADLSEPGLAVVGAEDEAC